MSTNHFELPVEVYSPEDADDCPFVDQSYIESLPFRDTPFWYSIKTARHIGIHKPDNRICNWTARIFTKDRKYKQKCVGPAINSGRGQVSFEVALQRAFEWFETGNVRSLATTARPKGRTTKVNFCPIGDVYSVGHALNDYTEWTQIARSEGGHYNNLMMINYHLAPWFLHIPLENFNATHLKQLAVRVLSTPPKQGFSAYRKQIAPTELSAAEVIKRKRTFNALVTILKMAFRYAWDCGKIESERPFRSLKRVSVVHVARRVFLNRDECHRLLTFCTPALKKLVLASLYTGCRVGELSRMTVEDVGRIGFGVYVGAFKRSPARFVFLPDEGMAFFLSQCEGKAKRDLLFRTDTGKVWKKHHTNLFRRAVSKADLPRELVFHGLRHTYASDLVRSGVPLDMVARQLGHSNTRTVIETYGHFAEHHREQLVRHCFSSLSANNKALSKQMKPRLDELWQTVQRKEWRDYAHIPETCTTPLRSRVHTHKDVLEVFDAVEK